MKNVITILLLLIIAVTSFSQQPPPVEKDFLKKSKNQKTTAWIMLGGGAALLATSIIIPKGDPINLGPWGPDNHTEYKNDGLKGTLGVIGFASMVGSIPFFIASGNNKKKAIVVSFKNERIPQLYMGGVIKHPVSSVNIKIRL